MYICKKLLMLIHFVQILVFSSLLLLSFITITNPLRVNKKANLWFGVTFLVWSTFWYEEILFLTKTEPFGTIPHLFISYLQFFVPICLYISVLYFSNPNYQFTSKNRSTLVLPIIYFFAIIFL